MKKTQLLELYDAYADHVFRLALSYLGNRADAEDIVQSVFEKLLRINLKLRRGCERSYILTMTANMCRNHLKSAGYRLSAPLDDADEYTEAGHTGADIYDVIDSLPDIYRTAMYLHYCEGYTFDETAKMLNISPSAVSMRISRGREKLKNILSKED